MGCMPAVHVDTEITENDILNALSMACDKLRIEDINDLCKESESRFSFCLRFIGNKLFKGTDYFKSDININNAYNVNKIDNIFNIYIDLCESFNKTPSFATFCGFVGVEYTYILDRYINNNIYNNISGKDIDSYSVDNNGILSPSWVSLYKKIAEYRNKSLRGKLSDGKQNPVGIIALMNNEFNFNGDKPESEQDRKCLSVNDLKSLLSVTNGQHKIAEYSKIAQQNTANVDN